MPSLASNPRHAPLRLLYAGMALLILVLLATNAAVILHLRDSELRDQENQLKNLSLTLAEQADRSFQSVDLVISSVVAEIGAEDITDSASFVRKMGGQDTHLLLREKMSGVPQLDAVTVISRDGKLVNFSRSWPVPEVDVSDRDYFQALTADPKLKSYVSAPVANRGNGAWTIFLARRVNGANGELLGLILGAIEMRYFEDFYRAISLGDGSTIAIQRLDGVMLARFPPTDDIGKTFSNAQHLLGNGVSGTVRELSPIDGQMRLKAAHLVTNYPMLALATKTEEAALANWRDIARLMSLGALGCAISIALAGIAVGRTWQNQAMLASAQAELLRQQERTAAYDALRVAKEAAEAANHAKSQFLATMGHELRTPLNAIIGLSELISEEIAGPLGNDRYRVYANDIHESGDHLLGIINDILDLSKAESGNLHLSERAIELSVVVAAVCRPIRQRITEAQLSFAVNIPPGDINLRADERMLKQILLNLLSNAVKFTPPGGQIQLDVTVDSSDIAFAIKDTGIGIPAEHLDRILHPFVQVDSSLSRAHEGTGLGLPLVKAMAELHGGSLRLDSQVGRGTTATVRLPLSRVSRASNDTVTETATAAWPFPLPSEKIQTRVSGL
jgi:signal transduction histidine kinase